MIHNRTVVAIAVAALGGYFGGRASVDAQVVGLVVMAVVGALAVFVAPNAETVAEQWRDHQQTERGETA